MQLRKYQEDGLIKMIEIINRYSNTDEPDERGRWARKIIYKGFLIGWISRLEHVKGEVMFEGICYFPSNSNDSPNSHFIEKSYNECLESIVAEWEKFKEKIL
jgi:hypothetical protein